MEREGGFKNFSSRIQSSGTGLLYTEYHVQKHQSVKMFVIV